jgi:hypothetical protein
MENTFTNFGGHKISVGKKYSTSEVKTGDVWIDGKPIYRKVVQYNLTSTQQSQQIATEVDVLVSANGYITGVNGTDRYPLNNFINSTDYSANWYVIDSSHVLRSTVASANTNRQGLVTLIIEYTKTTD